MSHTNYPNVLLIVLDAVRADHLSCYGYSRKTTPYIDRFAQNSVMFKEAIAPSCWTLPCLASLFTGLFASEHGVLHPDHEIRSDCVTLAEVLRKHDYKTIGITNNDYVMLNESFKRGFEIFLKPNSQSLRQNSNFWNRFISKARRGLLLTDSGARLTNKYVKQLIKKQLGKSQPFFLYLHYMETHTPYSFTFNDNYPFLGKLGILGTIKANIRLRKKFSKLLVKYYSGKMQFSQQEFHNLAVLYDNAILYLDKMMSQLFNFLDDKDLLADSLIIILGDHGENLGDNNHVTHIFSLQDSLLHVPLIIRLPTNSQKGHEITTQTQLTDVYPTVLDFLDIQDNYLQNLNSQSLLNLTEERSERLAFAEFSPWARLLQNLKKEGMKDTEIAKLRVNLQMIRTSDSKLITSSNGQNMLYNLNSDPHEKRDIAGKDPKRVSELMERLNEFKRSLNICKRFPTKQLSVNEKVKSRLESLGYL